MVEKTKELLALTGAVVVFVALVAGSQLPHIKEEFGATIYFGVVCIAAYWVASKTYDFLRSKVGR